MSIIIVVRAPGWRKSGRRFERSDLGWECNTREWPYKLSKVLGAMADLSSVVPSATSGGNTGGSASASFAGLLADVSAGGAGSQRVIEELLGDDPDQFYRGALNALRTAGEESRGLRFLVGLLATHDVLEPLLCEASLPVDRAAAALRIAIQLDPMVETGLARHVAEGVTTGRYPLLATNASRLLDILARVSDGTRILPSLSRLLHSNDVGLRSKAALIMGRSNRSAVWVQSHMTDADPRLRANAIEGLWGVGTEQARDLMMSSLHDTNNRVVGNALYGLYSMGEAVCLAETVKLAAHPVAVFRATAAWVMGETGDSRFRLPVAQLLRDEHPMVRSRALWAVARIKAATAHATTGPPWRLSSLLLESPIASATGPKTMRHVQVAVGAAGFAQPVLRAIQFMLTEDGQPVLNYRLTVRPSPPPMSVVFLFPRGGDAAEPPWVTAALACLAGKRSSDMWAYLPWMPASEAAGSVAPENQENQEIPFTPNRDALADSFRRMASRAESSDMWQTLWRALRAESNVARGKRHVIVFASEEVRGVAGHGLVATVGAARGIVQVISAVPNPALESLCGKTRIHYTYAATPEQIVASVEQAYINLNARFELSYQTLSQEARELKIRIQSPSGWGESTVAILPPAA
jgi:hypothetical protein